jgi:PLD-like domain
MTIEISGFTSGDDVFVHWRMAAPIPQCLGFALYRRRQNVEALVENYIGFEGDGLALPQPSSAWPIQRFRWTDHLVDAGDTVAYRVVARIGAAVDQLTDGETSPWTSDIHVSPGGKVSVFFNRGIVASQWVSRLLGGGDVSSLDKRLGEVMATVNDPVRNALAGNDRVRLLGLLTDAQTSGAEVYCSLYELDDPELIPALIALGQRAHVILANGSKSRISGTNPVQYTDGNKTSRAQLVGKVDLYSRMVDGNHLSHHKFAVIVEKGVAKRVWTGSTNWSRTGLCSQANNGLLIESKRVASDFLAQWNRLKAAGSDYPPSLAAADDTPSTSTVDGAKVTVWFAPTSKGGDMDAARALLDKAAQGILFLMFNPGPKNTLLTKILELRDHKLPDGTPQLYIKGVLNQDPGGGRSPVLRYDTDGSGVPLDKSVLLPAAIETAFDYWRPELRKYSKGFAMVHSKVIVIDPFGDHPVLMTGSHNMGPKASQFNDDNLVIIEGDAAAAQAHACVIMTIYDTYHWREWELEYQKTGKPNKGSHLSADAGWQDWPLAGGRRETDFWFGG